MSEPNDYGKSRSDVVDKPFTIKSLISGFSGLSMKLKTMATSPYDLSCWWDVEHKQQPVLVIVGRFSGKQ